MSLLLLTSLGGTPPTGLVVQHKATGAFVPSTTKHKTGGTFVAPDVKHKTGGSF